MTKQEIKREISSCFIPSSYFKYGETKKDIFKKVLRKEMKRYDAKRTNIRTLN